MGNKLFLGTSPAFQSSCSPLLGLSSPSPVLLTSISSSSCCVAPSRSLHIRSFHGAEQNRAERQERGREVTHAEQELQCQHQERGEQKPSTNTGTGEGGAGIRHLHCYCQQKGQGQNKITWVQQATGESRCPIDPQQGQSWGK